MWQTQYYLHLARMRDLEAAADRRRRWRLEDDWNGRPTARTRAANRARTAAARLAAGISRIAARLAVRLAGPTVVESRPDRVLNDA